MNGPEHYLEAERLVQVHCDQLQEAHDAFLGGDGGERNQALGESGAMNQVLAAAQVHATLALAAATAATRTISPVEVWGGRDVCTDGDWSEVAS